MWTRNVDTGKWFRQTDTLSKDNYDDLKQDLQKVKLFSKCLSGSTYLPINDLENIYSPLTINKIGYFINESPLYAINFPPQGPQIPLNTTNAREFYDKYLHENAFSIKNLFTPERLLNNQAQNIFEVDAATIEPITGIGSQVPNLTIDGVRLIDGNRVLVKDQFTEVELSIATDVEDYFTNVEKVSSYFEIEDNVTSKRYRFTNSQNGIYKYTNGVLVRESDLENYTTAYRYCVDVRSGEINGGKQFHLSRLKFGYFPLTSEDANLEFLEKTSWILRNRVDYNNQFDLNLQQSLYHATQSFYDIVDARTYSIPERLISVGEFGTILNNQGKLSSGATFSNSSIMFNKWKVFLRSIDQTERFYWICGNEGTLLKVDKVSFDISRVDLGEVNNLLSVSFYGNLNGMVVGEFNSIYYTGDGGYNWTKIDFPNFDLFSYNRVIHFNLTKAYVVGNGGLFLEMEFINNEWVSTKRRIAKFLTPTDEYSLVDDLRDAESVNLVSSVLATYSFAETSLDFYDSVIYRTSTNTSDQLSIELSSKYFDTQIEYGIAATPLKFRAAFEIEGSVTGPIYSSTNYPYSLPNPVPGTASWDMYQDSFSTKKRIFTYSLPTDSEGNIINQELTIRSNIIYNYDGVSFTPLNSWYQAGVNTEFTYGIETSPFICMVGNDNRFIVYDIESKLSSYNPFIYFSFSQSHSDIVTVAKSKTSGHVFIGGDKIYRVNLGDIRSVTSDKNWIDSSSQPWGDFFVNDITTNTSELFITGNGTMVKRGSYSTASYTDVDPTFLSKLKSKLLFLDYDMASKLNFFTDLGEYRLPQSVTFSYTQTSSPLIIGSLPNEFSFLDYQKDSEKTFKFGTSFQDSNVVKFSTTFTQSNTTATFSFVGSQISDSLSLILPLAPGINTEGSSRYISQGTIVTNYSVPFRCLLYKYLVIFVDLRQVSVGDVLYLKSNVIDTTLVVNRIESIGFVNHLGLGSPAVNYVYCYTEFNDNIIRNLKASTSQITVVNLNKYTNVDQLVSKFESHPASVGYKLEKESGFLKLSPRFNNKTAYYNLQSRSTLATQTKDLLYEESFLNFGYSPTYNIQDYLYKIEPNIFDSNIKFSILPEYSLLPGNGGNSATSSNIYVDLSVGIVNTGTFSYYRSGTNTIIFGEDYKFHWESLLIHTFVDLELTGVSGTTYSVQKCLITKKYYDNPTGGWGMDFHKKLEVPDVPISSFTIRSRNSLSQISSDLQILNNVQRTQITKSLQTNYTFTNLENELKYKFPTDSYMKVLVSDWRIKKYLSGIIYTDYDYNIALNILQVGENKSYQFYDTSAQNSAGFTNRLKLDFNSSHEVEVGDLIYIEFNGGSQSSEFLNTDYFGYHRVIETFSTVGSGYVILDHPFGQNTLVDPGILSFYKVDPFFNYQPIDLFRVGVDKKVTRSVEIKPDNFQVVGATWSLVNLDLSKFKLRFVDGLYLEEVYQKYHWLLEAEVSNAIIGRGSSGLIWYSGDWLCGRWFGGTWMSGRWVSGDWYGGTWNSYKTEDRIINIYVDTSNVDFRSSRWFGGRWFDGVWNGGSWFNGRKYAGLWIDGIWYGGIWNDGTWMSGRFEGGVWVLGTWESGVMNSDSKPVYWLDGEFKTGDFENGIWYNGKFGNDRRELVRFGTRSFNTRPSVWNGGTWRSGEFHSNLNIDSDTGLPAVSDIHKYSVWKTGNWLGGDFWGGIAYNINFSAGIWHGGILEEIQVIGVNSILPSTQSTNSIVLNGVFRFNIGDEVWIIDDDRDTPYSPLGSNTTPRKYRINFVQEDEVLDRTTIRLNYNLSTLGVTASYASQSLVGFETGLRVVSYFKDSIWETGLWTNGIFENGSINSIIWYNGILVSGDWGN